MQKEEINSKTLEEWYETEAKRLDILKNQYLSDNQKRRLFFQNRAACILGIFMKEVPKGSIVCDLGCGAGWYVYKLVEAGYIVDAVDISKNILIQARQFVSEVSENVNFYQADVCETTLFNNFYDAILATEIIEHLMNPNDFLKEAKRILKPGGKILISVPSILNPLEQSYYLKKRIKKEFYEHLHFYTPFKLAKQVKCQGFRIIYMRTCNFTYPVLPIGEYLSGIAISIFHGIEGLLPKIPIMKFLGWTVICLAELPAEDLPKEKLVALQS